MHGAADHSSKARFRFGGGLLTQSIHLGGEHEVVFGEAVYCMSEEGEAYFAPGEEDVGVVALLFGELADLVGEGERFTEVFEGELLMQVMLVHHGPAGPQLAGESCEFAAFQGRDSAFARNTVFLR